ncbi:MAG: hypothetical protein RR406_03510 [Bacilli bacterium]
MKNYFIFPMETLNISQSYNEGNHLPHTTGTPKDYPIDICGIDSNQSAIFCPCDEIKVVGVYNPSRTDYANTLYLKSTTECITPSGVGEVFATYTHINDAEISKFYVGQLFHRGDIICYEGTSGNATGNHIHLCVGFGNCTNMIQNNSGKWVMKGDNRHPEDMMYIDSKFTTTIKNKANLSWQYVPVETVGTPVSRNNLINQVEITKDLVRGYKNPNGEVLGYINKGIYNYTETSNNGNYTWYLIEADCWVVITSECGNIYIADSTIEDSKVTELETKIKNQQDYINSLEVQLKNMDLVPSLKTFLVPETGDYYIFLNQGEILTYKITSSN